MPQRSIEQVLKEKTKEWLAVPGVVGTAMGLAKGKPSIKVFTSSDPQSLQAKFPSTVEGYPVIIERTGTFRAVDPD